MRLWRPTLSEETKDAIVAEVTQKTKRSINKNIWLSNLISGLITVGGVFGFLWGGIQLFGWSFGVGLQFEALKALPPKVAALEHGMQSLNAAVERIGDRQLRGTKTLQKMSSVADEIRKSHTKM